MSEMSKNIDDMLGFSADYFYRKDCQGCGMCMSICPVGALDMEHCEDGTDRPLVDMSKCIRCTRCMEACEIYKGYHS